MILIDLRDFFIHSLGIIYSGIWKRLKGQLLNMWLPLQEPVLQQRYQTKPRQPQQQKNELAVIAAKAPHTTYVSHSSEEPWKDQGFYKFRSEEILSGALEMSHWVPKGWHFFVFSDWKPSVLL